LPSAVLVVADDESVLHFVEQVLRRGGFDVETVCDSFAAAERIAKSHYDAIFLDLADALTVLRYLEGVDGSLLRRTVLATSRPRDAASRELRDICRVIVKPFDARRLLDAVSECLP
jgi:DNA-binding NtrC family response regulator